VAQRIVQVDAFTATPFAGNPAAVCILAAPAEPAWMQSVAHEMNLAETAFLVPRGGAEYDLRWFTPAAEVPLCGHATLASAHALWEGGDLPPGSTARFHTKSGVLTARQADAWIEMDFPAEPPSPEPAPPGLLDALGIAARWTGRRARLDYWLVEVADEDAVRRVAPDSRAVARAARAVIVTARASSGNADFVSRFFAPALAVDEDPVTGSAHCVLAPFWAERFGRSELTGYQASPRGGVVRVRVAGDRVILAGQAVTVMRGELWT
jgi:PhzF family phenazine biosynthesis protein